jgi:hypothetical protein
MVLKIYGERNCGTNYLRQLVLRNLDVTLLPGTAPRWLRRRLRGNESLIDLYFRLTRHKNLGWKHAVAPSLSELKQASVPVERVGFITLSKNPYSWLISLFRHPYHYQAAVSSFERFLRTPWETVGRENHPTTFANPVAMWNVKNASYLRLQKSVRCMHLRYEDLLRAPEQTLAAIAQAYALHRRTSTFVNLQKSTKGETDKSYSHYQDYYLNERWRDALCDEDIAWINDNLDGDVMSALRYARCEPSSGSEEGGC